MSQRSFFHLPVDCKAQPLANLAGPPTGNLTEMLIAILVFPATVFAWVNAVILDEDNKARDPDNRDELCNAHDHLDSAGTFP